MRAALALAATALAAASALLAPTAAAGFAFLPGAEGFEVAATKAGGGAETQAGAHPFEFRASLAFDGSGAPRDLTVHTPPGFLLNPTALPECGAAAFATPRGDTAHEHPSASGEHCPNATQVGIVRVSRGGGAPQTRSFGLFSLVPPHGTAAALGAAPWGAPLRFLARVREGDAGIDLALEDVPASLQLRALEVTVWGTPQEAVHDGQRGDCLNEEEPAAPFGVCGALGGEGAAAIPQPPLQVKSYLTLPTTPCGAPLSLTAGALSWQGQSAAASAALAPLAACNTDLTTASLKLMTSEAAARSGLVFDLQVNDGGGILNPGGIARPAIKTAIASLPAGLTLNPSLGAGLGSCGEAEWARETATSEPGAGCPNQSKIGTVTLAGALGLAEPLQGSLYLARPRANPFGTLLALYMVARSPRRGLIVRSQGKLEPDPRTGQLRASFENLPRLLYTHFVLTLREGQRAALLSPPLCGAYRATLQVSSWAAPASFRTESTAFPIDRGPGAGPCPGGTPPFAPGLIAGSLNPSPAAYTPFYLRMTRGDGEQEITSYSATLPPGLLAKIAGVSECPGAAIEAAKGRRGAAEQAAPSCPAAARIGRTMAGCGVGGTLAWAPGELYLAGPYHGAPLSVVAIDAATIGPFDLGTVVVRQAIRIDPRTAQASIDASGSDPIPHILDGIPLHLRDIRVYVERPDFTVTPTSCDPMAVTSRLGGAGADPLSGGDDTSATSTQRYQLLGCRALGLRPRLSLRLRGSTRHGGYPSLRATYRPRPGDANLSAAAVTLPPSVFLAQEHIRSVCTHAQFAAGACPRGSAYGWARAVTPLMDQPLEGPVYLRSSHTAVPDLVADLRGRGIEIEVPARIDSSRGGIRASFEALPDAPLSSFTLTMRGGKRGLLANGETLCPPRRPGPRAYARFLAQNNATAVGRPRLTARCAKPKAQRRHHHTRKGGRR